MLEALLDWANAEVHACRAYALKLWLEGETFERPVIDYGPGWVALSVSDNASCDCVERLYINERYVIRAQIVWHG